MGDEPYAALLPWMVFAVVDRARGDDPLWAGIGAVLTVITLLATSSRHRESRSANVVLLGALVWFSALATAGALHRANTGFVAHNGRVLSAAGYALIAFGSLAFKPASEHYTLSHVRSSRWSDPAFKRLNVVITLIWATAFSAIAVAAFAATALSTTEGFTVFNWVLPILIAAMAAHRTRMCWDDFNDDDDYEVDPIRDLSIDWEGPSVPTDT